MTTKILLDTDIGSDIDDALCLAYLLAKPECELLGITTVSGEADKRAMMASAMCKIAGKQIPILPGVENPLLIQAQQPTAPQATELVKWAHESTFPRGEAIEFLRHTIHAHPGEVVLLGIGPLTNIALLFSVDPEIPVLLKELVLMCGIFTERATWHPLPQREWNALNDPHAAEIVYRARVRRHRSLGLDVTTHVTMDANQFREKCYAPLLCPIRDFAEIWFKQRDIVTFHDPLAATAIFDEAICKYTRGKVNIEIVDKGLEGKTYWHPNSAAANVEIALEVDAERFFKEYFSVF
jgi:purine nucleosidase